MNGVALISCFFLADALRRIYNSYKEHTGLMSNEKVMGLHLILLVVYFLSILGKSYNIQQWIDNPTSSNYNTALFFYTVSMWLVFFDQLMLCYLFIKFSQNEAVVLTYDETGSVSVG
jgi:hypothetical protein